MKKFIALCALALPLLAFAKIDMEALPGRHDSIYKSGDSVVFKYKVTENGSPAQGMLRFEIYREGFTPMERRFEELGEDGTLELNIDSREPGNIMVRATLCDFDKQQILDGGKPVSRMLGAMVDPETLKSPFEEPADFDAFWNRARKELKDVPMEVLQEREFPVSKQNQGKIRGFDVRIAAPGGKPASGILAVPANAKPKSLPAIIVFHGAGVHSAWLREDNAKKYNAIVFDVNAHGIENHKRAQYYKDIEKGALKNYLLRLGKEEPESNYFKYMMLRDLRVLEYIRTRPEWDGRTIVVSGGSQGGAQALFIASLDPSVTFCKANIPWMTVPAAPAKGYFQVPEWCRQIHVSRRQPVNPEAIDRLGYFDAANAVKRMKGECVIVYGLRDEICPASGVWMTYNNIPGRKKIFGSVNKGHQNIPSPDYIASYLKKARVK